MDPNWLSAAADLITALGLGFLGYQAFLLRSQVRDAREQARDEHDRSRREFTINLMQDWNRTITPFTAAAVRVAGELSPELCEDIVKLRPAKLPKRLKTLIETCLADVLSGKEVEVEGDSILLGEREVTRLRFLVADYLNATESALSAWHIGCADSAMMKAQFREVALDVGAGLEHFRNKMGGALAFPAISHFARTLLAERDAATPPQRSEIRKS